MRLAFWILLGIGVWQDTPPADSGLVIRSTTSLVQVRVVAQDSKGRPVTDLQREDFQVQDDRKTQPITFFSADRGGASSPVTTIPGSEPALMRRGGEYCLLLLDWLNSSYADRYRSRESILDMLKTYRAEQKVAVYVLSKEPHLVHDFTSDMTELAQAILDAGLQPEDMGPDAPPGQFDARYGNRVSPRLSKEEQLFYVNNRVNDSFHTLELVADRLARLPGRKSLIWLSSAFPLLINGSVVPGASAAEVTYYQNMERLLARLNRADVAVYPVDACGLSLSCRHYPQTMEQISERTGGIMFAGRNDIGNGVRIALEDLRVSYMIGFQVPAGAAPGLHEIRVRVKRAGVAVRYRESYELR